MAAAWNSSTVTGIGPPRHPREGGCNPIPTSSFGTDRPKIGGRQGLLFEACGRVSDPRLDRGDSNVAILQSKIRRRELDYSLLRDDDESATMTDGHRLFQSQ